MKIFVAIVAMSVILLSVSGCGNRTAVPLSASQEVAPISSASVEEPQSSQSDAETVLPLPIPPEDKQTNMSMPDEYVDFAEVKDMKKITDSDVFQQKEELIRKPSNGGLLEKTWSDPNELDPRVVMFFYNVNGLIETGEKYRDGDTLYIPMDVVKEYIGRFFRYDIERCKNEPCYNAEKNTFDFDVSFGFGSAIYTHDEIWCKDDLYLFVQTDLDGNKILTLIEQSETNIAYIKNYVSKKLEAVTQ